MWSKNKARMTTAEREHVGKVKASGCALCGCGGVVEAHEIEQGEWYTSIGLCPACHRGPNGLHGDKTLWRIYKMTEIQALNETLRRLYG